MIEFGASSLGCALMCHLLQTRMGPVRGICLGVPYPGKVRNLSPFFGDIRDTRLNKNRSSSSEETSIFQAYGSVIGGVPGGQVPLCLACL